MHQNAAGISEEYQLHWNELQHVVTEWHKHFHLNNRLKKGNI